MKTSAAASRVLGRPYFRHLDGLRGLFFLLVFLVHAVYYQDPRLLTHWLRPLVSLCAVYNGALVLSFFFVMSSFLITMLLLREHSKTGRISISGFYLRRTLRIWPLYFALLAVSFGVYPWLRSFGSHPYTGSDSLWQYVLFVQNWFFAAGKQPDSPLLGPTWSIAVEEQFYLVWPLLLTLVPVRHLFVALLGLLGVALCWQFSHPLNFFHTFTCATDLLIGSLVAVAVYEAEQRRNPWARRWLLAVRRMPRWLIVVLWGLGFYLYRYGLSMAPAAWQPFERLAVDTMAGVALLEQNYSRHSLFKLGNSEALRRLGQLAFGLYLLHVPALTLIRDGYNILHLHKSLWDSILFVPLLGFGLTLGLAMLSFRFYELPFLRLYAKLRPKPADAVVPVAPAAQPLPTLVAPAQPVAVAPQAVASYEPVTT